MNFPLILNLLVFLALLFGLSLTPEAAAQQMEDAAKAETK